MTDRQEKYAAIIFIVIAILTLVVVTCIVFKPTIETFEGIAIAIISSLITMVVIICFVKLSVWISKKIVK